MKKIALTVRIPIFVDIELEVEDKDFDDLIDEWDKANFGLVKSIVEKYADLENLGAMGSQERFGDTEIVDVRLFGEEIIPEDEAEEPEQAYGIEINTITPKGKPN